MHNLQCSDRRVEGPATHWLSDGYTRDISIRGELTMAASIRTIQLQIQCRARHSDVCNHLTQSQNVGMWEGGFWLSWPLAASLLHSEAKKKASHVVLASYRSACMRIPYNPTRILPPSDFFLFLSSFLSFFLYFNQSIIPSHHHGQDQWAAKGW